MLIAVSALLGIAGAYRLVCKGYKDYWQGQRLKEKALKKRAKRLNKAKNKQQFYIMGNRGAVPFYIYDYTMDPKKQKGFRDVENFIQYNNPSGCYIYKL